MNKEISDNNKLVIIGNGFDLAHGLKTRYSDFLNNVLTELFNEYSNSLTSPSPIPFFIVNKNGPRNEYQNIDSFINSISLNAGNGIIVEKNKYFSNLLQDTLSISDSKWVNIEMHFFNKLKWYFDK